MQNLFRRAGKYVRVSPSPEAPLVVVSPSRVKRKHGGTLPNVPELRAVVSGPVLTPDGRWLTQPGFDEQTGIYQTYTAPVIAEHPTADEVEQAKHVLLHLVRNFPFAAPKNRSAWLAGLLTPFVRHAFDEPVPLFLIDKNGPRIGGTLLYQITSTIATGTYQRLFWHQLNEDDTSRMLTAVVQRGFQLAVFDDIYRPFGNHTLARALTVTQWSNRLLHSQNVANYPLLTVFWACGNNVQLTSDLSRRVLPIRLKLTPSREAELPNLLGLTNLHRYAAIGRAEYVQAVMTLVQAFTQSGAAQTIEIPPWGSYSAWSNSVRKLIVWLGLPDPYPYQPISILPIPPEAEAEEGGPW